MGERKNMKNNIVLLFVASEFDDVPVLADTKYGKIYYE